MGTSAPVEAAAKTVPAAGMATAAGMAASMPATTVTATMATAVSAVRGESRVGRDGNRAGCNDREDEFVHAGPIHFECSPLTGR